VQLQQQLQQGEQRCMLCDFWSWYFDRCFNLVCNACLAVAVRLCIVMSMFEELQPVQAVCVCFCCVIWCLPFCWCADVRLDSSALHLSCVAWRWSSALLCLCL
jgi:hypothetical protein